MSLGVPGGPALLLRAFRLLVQFLLFLELSPSPDFRSLSLPSPTHLPTCACHVLSLTQPRRDSCDSPRGGSASEMSGIGCVSVSPCVRVLGCLRVREYECASVSARGGRASRYGLE